MQVKIDAIFSILFYLQCYTNTAEIQVTTNQTDGSKAYSVSQKKGATLYMAITLSILDRFAKFFHCCKEQ